MTLIHHLTDRALVDEMNGHWEHPSMTRWEREFVFSIYGQVVEARRPLSVKQRRRFAKVAYRLKAIPRSITPEQRAKKDRDNRRS